MGMNIHHSHRLLFLIPAVTYLVLVAVCAVIPAMIEQQRDELSSREPAPSTPPEPAPETAEDRLAADALAEFEAAERNAASEEDAR